MDSRNRIRQTLTTRDVIREKNCDLGKTGLDRDLFLPDRCLEQHRYPKHFCEVDPEQVRGQRFADEV